MIKYRLCPITLVTLGMLVSSDLLADNIDFTLEVVYQKPVCHIKGEHGEHQITVQFGDMPMNKLDGQQYIKAIPFSLDCEENVGPIGLTLLGNASPQGGLAVTGNPQDGLELALLVDGKPSLNTPFPVEPGRVPLLQAVPQRLTGAPLKIGHFTASASIQVEYL